MDKKKMPWIIWIILIVLFIVIGMMFDIDIPSRWGILYSEVSPIPD